MIDRSDLVLYTAVVSRSRSSSTNNNTFIMSKKLAGSLGARRSSIPSNRKCVVVDQTMVKTEETGDSVNLEARFSGTSFQDSLSECEMRVTERQTLSVDDLHPSPSGSVRSSSSSFLGSTGGLDISFSRNENKLLDEVKAGIESTAAQLMKLEVKVEEIPVLEKKVEETEREKRMIAKDLSEKCEIVATLKQRLSVLHEQNSQLAQLTQGSKDTSEATLRMRNALVASLAQLKKLQGIVDEVPELKGELSILKQENLQLKQQEQVVLKRLSINLPVGATPMDYNSLVDENEELKCSNESLASEVLQLSRNIGALSDSMEDLRERVQKFEKSVSNSVPLSNHIKKLEKEKEELYDEIIRIKLDKSISLSIDTVYLDNECATLRKTNSVLQNRLDELTTQYKQQKEKMITKLFEIEVYNIKSRKFEIEEHNAVARGAVPTDENDIFPPQFKAQILKLQQFRLQSDQSHEVMQLILSEKEDQEKDIVELRKKLDDQSIKEMECQLKQYENRLEISHAKISDLENKLQISSHEVSSDYSALVAENVSLKSQLHQLRNEGHAVTITELKKQLLEQQHLQEASHQKCKKVKDQKQKLETKLKESKTRYQVIALELSNSVELMKNYQTQCVHFEKNIDVLSMERESFRKELSSLKAQLEIMNAECTHSTPDTSEGAHSSAPEYTHSAPDTSEGAHSSVPECTHRAPDSSEGTHRAPDTTEGANSKTINEVRAENYALKQKVLANSKEAEGRIYELKIIQEKLDAEILNAKQANLHFEANLKEKLDEHKLSKDSFEKNICELTLALSSKTDEVTKLKTKLNRMEDEYHGILSQLSDSKDEESELRTELNRMKSEYQCILSQLSDSKTENSRLLVEVDDLKSENSAFLSANSRIIDDLTSSLRSKESDVARLKENADECLKLQDKIEGYQAIIKSLQRQVDEAETRELEHELLKQKILLLERSLGNSSTDNKELLKLLHQTVKEIPSFSQAEQSLQDRNLQLEEQNSLLSQWNDKQRQQIEQLEERVTESTKVCEKLIIAANTGEELSQYNLQLKQELMEVEIEVNTLRRQVQGNNQEELQIKLEAKTQLLDVFNQHNTLLQRQVEELQSQVKYMGGKLDREKAVSPPPMPDMALSLTITSEDDSTPQSNPSLKKENIILKQRVKLMVEEVEKLEYLSADVRRYSSSLHALSTISIGNVNDDVLVTVPREMLLACSLLTDHLNLNTSLDDPAAKLCISTIRLEWFACVSQRSLSPACAQCYIAKISQLSHKLLDVVVNLQDDKGNTALHYTASNGNLPALNQFINLRGCDPCLLNMAGYNALMLFAACMTEVDITVHKKIVITLIERSGVNAVGKKNQRTALMLAAASGNSVLIKFLLEKDCDINSRDKDGSTALMFAVQREHADIVKTLMSYSSCDIFARDNEGQTAKDIAKAHGYEAILSLFKKTKS